MHQKFINLYLDIAKRVSAMSTAKKLNVGAIVVKDNRIISLGYNGTPSGWDNNCEEEYVDEDGTTVLKTLPEVLHAESNCISKLARSSESGQGSTMFSTHSPCLECAKLIYQSGISEVYYREDYRSDQGIKFLKKCGVKIEQFVGLSPNKY
jgi:dCMP deaminase